MKLEIFIDESYFFNEYFLSMNLLGRFQNVKATRKTIKTLAHVVVEQEL
jgi:hypothetical protein